MKKTFKRAGVAVLSMAMLLSMGAIGGLTVNATKNLTPVSVSAPAADTTIGQGTATYKIYTVAVAALNSDASAYTYTVDSDFASTTTINDITSAYSNAAATKTLANALAAAVPGTPDFTVTSGNSVNLVPGYYLAIMDPTGTQMTAAPILFNVDSDVASPVLAVKTSGVTFDKEIVDVDDNKTAVYVGASKKTAQGKIGSVVTYKLEAKLPAYAPDVNASDIEYYIVDTPSAGLTILDTNNSATVNGIAYTMPATTTVAVTTNGTPFTGSDYVIDSDYGTNGNALKVTITGDYIKNNPSSVITVTYDAVINDNANISTDTSTISNDNVANLYYDNDYYTASKSDGTDLEKTPDKVTKVYTTKLNFKKLFAGHETNVTGASFTLTGPNGFSESFNTNSTNVFEFKGLEAGSYTLVENDAPDGYEKAGNVTINIAADTENASDVYTFTFTGANTHSDTLFTMNNQPKNTLPGTGGMGTTLFTVGGAVIVLMAGFMFVLYMRKRKTEE